MKIYKVHLPSVIKLAARTTGLYKLRPFFFRGFICCWGRDKNGNKLHVLSCALQNWQRNANSDKCKVRKNTMHKGFISMFLPKSYCTLLIPTTSTQEMMSRWQENWLLSRRQEKSCYSLKGLRRKEERKAALFVVLLLWLTTYSLASFSMQWLWREEEVT